jgi:hypothetical protein
MKTSAVNSALRYCEADHGTVRWCGAVPPFRFAGTGIIFPRYRAARTTTESNMPILLLVGVPVFLLGGGYLIIHAMH